MENMKISSFVARASSLSLHAHAIGTSVQHLEARDKAMESEAYKDGLNAEYEALLAESGLSIIDDYIAVECRENGIVCEKKHVSLQTWRNPCNHEFGDDHDDLCDADPEFVGMSEGSHAMSDPEIWENQYNGFEWRGTKEGLSAYLSLLGY